SVADTQNYGDDSSARYLVNPSQFSQFGIEDSEFFVNRGKVELRALFESIGQSFSAEVFQLIWENAVGSEQSEVVNGEETCTIVDFQRALNDFLHRQENN
ncbi:unnamed protein product, partial [Ectocarpus sp. 8 AP-2014]